MLRIAASPARSHETWSLAATTTERSDIVGLMLTLLSRINPKLRCEMRFERRAAFVSVRAFAIPCGWEFADARNCSGWPGLQQRDSTTPRPFRTGGLVSRRLKGYNGDR